jgi:WD40 repeat protein/biotin carboxyl carrier protein
MRLRTPLFAMLLVGLVVGCGKKPPALEPGTKGTPETSGPKVNLNPDVGGSLYPVTAAPNYPTVVSRNTDVVISNAIGQYDRRQIISAEVDGTIDQIATPVLPGETVPKDQIVYLRHDMSGKNAPLRELRDGVEVKDGQALVIMDARQIIAKTQGAEKVKVSAEAALRAATEGKKDAFKQLELVRSQNSVGAGARKEEIEASLAYNRYVENEAQSAQTIARAESDIAEGLVLLTRHTVLSRVNGVIRSVVKRPGEYVKAGEKIMEIEVTDTIRIEGQLDVQYAQYAEDAKKRGLAVSIEPAVTSAQIAGHTGHRQAVTGVAVVAAKLGDEVIPLVVSVGADGAALVWDPNLGKQASRPAVPHSLPHPVGVGVRSVAAVPMSAKAALVITGADDGKVRVWDVSNPAKLPEKAKAEPEDAHTTAVNSIAVSPRGDFFATAAGRDVFIWDLAAAKKKYALPVEHRDNVTSVSFTPQGTLVTASKDGTIKIWKLGTERAAVTRSLDHRAGAVETLGVSRDGARLLFDQDKTRIDLVDPATGQTVGQIQNVSSAGSFSTLAAFGPDELAPGATAEQSPYQIVTAGGDGDLKGTLQYWLAPRAGGRGAEKGRLITPGRAAVTAAAFSPIRNTPFVVVGTAAGGVCLWKPPAENQKGHTGKIVNIDATDTRYVTVRVELDNKADKLPDKNAFTVIIPTNP